MRKRAHEREDVGPVPFKIKISHSAEHVNFFPDIQQGVSLILILVLILKVVFVGGSAVSK